MNCLIDKIPTWSNEIKLLHPSFQGHIRVGQLLPIYGDMGTIYQIFMNIISNAVKYSSKNDTADIEIYSEETSEGIVYFIKDNGIGIPEDELNKVFSVFNRATNAIEYNKGTGVGLSLAKRIIERYGGSINLSSTIGKGTLVRLFFPNKLATG